MVKMAIGLLAILAPLQLFIGDQHGLNTLKHQPVKVAAMEAHWDGSKPGDFHLFAWPDEKNEKNLFEISIPRGASLILTHDPNGLFPGLTSVRPSDRPPVKTVFFAFRIMLDIGFFMIAAALFGALLWWRGRLFDTRWYLHIVAHSWWTGFVAVVAGWIVTESGRQPWLVHGLLRTADAVSPVRQFGRHNAGAFRPRLRDRVLRRHLLHQPADRGRSAAAQDQSGGRAAFGEPACRGTRRRPSGAWRRLREGRNGMVSPGYLGRPDRHRRRALRHPRWLRSRPWHPVSDHEDGVASAIRSCLRSRRSGTATRPGWCWAAADCWSRFLWPTPSSCRHSTCR